MSVKRFILLILVMVPLAGTLEIYSTNAQAESIPAIELDPTFAVDWMQMIYERLSAERYNPPMASRVYAYAGITLYESLLNGIPGNYTLAGQIIHMPDLPLPQEGVYDWVSVANRSLYRVMSELLPATPETTAALTAYYESLKAEREAEVSSEVVALSNQYADELSDVLLEWIADDGYADIRALPDYETLDYGEAGWVPTSEGQTAVEPYWGQMRPFMMEYSSDCSVPLDMTFSTDPNSTFYQQALEVQLTGRNLTQEQIDIAYFWVDAPGLSGLPSGHWMLIAGLMVDHLDLPLDQAAEMYALVGMALADSFISAWEAKYRYMLLRPVTYIQQHIRRGWGPLIETPGFPEYPSGHSVASNAAATVLTRLFGQVAFVDTSGQDRGFRPRSFTSFSAAAYEAAISRLYGGIHFRVGIENGLLQGRCVGETVMRGIRLNPFRQGE